MKMAKAKKVVVAAVEVEAAAVSDAVVDNRVIRVLEAGKANPKKAGSAAAERYNVVLAAGGEMRVADYLAAEPCKDKHSAAVLDLTYNVKKGFWAVEADAVTQEETSVVDEMIDETEDAE